MHFEYRSRFDEASGKAPSPGDLLGMMGNGAAAAPAANGTTNAVHIFHFKVRSFNLHHVLLFSEVPIP